MNRCGAFLIAWALIGCGGKSASDSDHGASAASTSGAGGAVANGGAGSASSSGGPSTVNWGGTGGGSSSASGGSSSASGGSSSGGSSNLYPCGTGGELSDVGVGGESAGGSPGNDPIVRTCTQVGLSITECAEFAFATQTEVDDFDAKCRCSYGSPNSTCDEIGAVAECRSADTSELPHHVRTVYYGISAEYTEDKCTDPGQTWTAF